MPALFSGSGEYPYSSTFSSYMLRYPCRSPAFQSSTAVLKTLIGLMVKAPLQFRRNQAPAHAD
jgi:hypothetical protein